MKLLHCLIVIICLNILCVYCDDEKKTALGVVQDELAGIDDLGKANQELTNDLTDNDIHKNNDDIIVIEKKKPSFWKWHWNWEFIAGAIGFSLFMSTILCVVCVYKYDHHSQQSYGFHPIDITEYEYKDDISINNINDGELDSLKNKKQNNSDFDDSDTDVSIEQDV